MTINANENQNTPSRNDLDAQIAADEAARNQPQSEPVSQDDNRELEQKAQTNTKQETDKPEQQEEHAEEQQEEHQPEESEYEKRIARQAHKAREAERRARTLEAEVARLRGNAPPLSQEEEISRAVEQRAAQLAAQKAFDDQSNAIYQKGIETFGQRDFDAKLAEFRTAQLPLTPELVEAAAEAGDAHKIIHYLARNIDEAERIMSLPAHKMGAALAKINSKSSPVKAQSKAPPPIKPIGGAVKTALSDEDMPIDEYMRKEDERTRSSRGRWAR